ncbi:unnamed protein product [Linum tenue]|uniref:F-box domain-containing protein n=1 Tax=Linum tenue TaxID=586396 RepID=A0AAV0IK72_9ROSI|nr:unnamed protein product [Linum tenue]
MNKEMGNSTKLLELVKERSMSKKVEDEGKEKQVSSYLDKDCITSILMKLPLESLPSSRFVCKAWYDIINSLPFINNRLEQSESVLIYVKPTPMGSSHHYSSPTSTSSNRGNKFSVEGKVLQSQPLNMFAYQMANRSSKFSINFVECREGKGVTGDYGIECLGSIRAACNGFILLDNRLKKGGVLVMNPVTRNLLALPVGTLTSPEWESYGFALTGGRYKVVHLFMDDMKYIACETLNLGSRSWKPVNGPPSGRLPRFGFSPVSAIGALHWLPTLSSDNNFTVSMDLETEKFHLVPLPKICGTHDRILEMGSLLGFITHEDLHIDVWKLKSVVGQGDDAVWTKHHKITRGSLIDMVPLFCLRIKGDVIFKRHEGGSVYSYDFESETMTMVEMDEMDEEFRFYANLLPHVNSLGSWTAATQNLM